ncbi:helix-turn-helix transcriptional regulator [Actinoplanes sp. NPDC049599]|uniref:helix-turn-helix transcriptional regulator n=1 Tax=Actinoplanes sp. NPDC049599 TaxID=3363903 RepID=UPI00378D531C
MPHPASRVLAMLELLQAHRSIRGGELAARLAVDERTVRRYAGTLAELGIPVTAERGRYGGYRLLPGFRLPPLMLTDDEAVAVVLGLVAADRLGLAVDAPASAAAEAKISRVLPTVLADRLAALRASLGLTLRRREPDDPPRAGAVPSPADLLLTLGTATRSHQRLAITYRAPARRPAPPSEPPASPPQAGGEPAASSRSGGEQLASSRSGAEPPIPSRIGDELPEPPRAGGEPAARVSRREVDPYGLVFHSGRWYLVAHDHRTDEIRSFRLDRITAAAPTGAGFEAPPNFDAVAHVTRQWAGLPWKWEVEVLIEADVAQVRRRVPAAVADVTEVADGVRLSCRAQSLPGMAQMLAGLGWPFTVVRPDELRTALAEHAANLVRYAAR